jgi:hypothetical protein
MFIYIKMLVILTWPNPYVLGTSRARPAWCLLNNQFSRDLVARLVVCNRNGQLTITCRNYLPHYRRVLALLCLAA